MDTKDETPRPALLQPTPNLAGHQYPYNSIGLLNGSINPQIHGSQIIVNQGKRPSSSIAADC